MAVRKLTSSQRLLVEKMIAQTYPKGDLAVLVAEAIAVIEETPTSSKPTHQLIDKIQVIEESRILTH